MDNEYIFDLWKHSQIEYKNDFSTFSSLLEDNNITKIVTSLVAFMNSDSGGIILIGADNKLNFRKDISFTLEYLEKLKKKIEEKFKKINYKRGYIYLLEHFLKLDLLTIKKNHIIKLETYATEEPVLFDSNLYIRRDEKVILLKNNNTYFPELYYHKKNKTLRDSYCLILNQVLVYFIEINNIKKVLFFQYGGPKETLVFKNIFHSYYNFLENDKIMPTGDWELVFGLVPYLGKQSTDDINPNNLILKSLKNISDNGIGIYMQSAVFLNRLDAHLKRIEKQGFYLNAVVNLGSIFSAVNVNCVLSFYSKTKTKLLFVSEIERDLQGLQFQLEGLIEHILAQKNADQYGLPRDIIGSLFDDDGEDVPENFHNNVSIYTPQESDDPSMPSPNLWDGVFVEHSKFKGFKHLEIGLEIKKLKSDYIGFKQFKISDLILDIKTTKDKFNDIENAVYLYSLGSSKCTDNLKDIDIKHQNFFQIIFKKELVSPKYVCVFFNNTLGKKIIEHKLSSGFLSIKKLKKIDVIDIELPIPNKYEQDKIINMHNKIDVVYNNLKTIQSNLSLNPVSSKESMSKLDDLVESIGKLSYDDQIRRKLKEEENIKLEFKSSFQVPYPMPEEEIDESHQKYYLITKNNKKEKIYGKKNLFIYFQTQCLKTIVAFLNSKGGILIIGVEDNKNVLGIDREGLSSNDKYTLHLHNVISNRIGKEFLEYIEIKFANINYKSVCIVKCNQYSPAINEDPVKLDNKIVYTRKGPSSEVIDGVELAKLMIRKWNKKEE